MPVTGKRACVHAGYSRNALERTSLFIRVKDPGNEAVAESPRKIRPKRLPDSIRRYTAAVQCLERRQFALFRSVANPCGRNSIDWSDRQILSHPFGKPERHCHTALLFRE